MSGESRCFVTLLRSRKEIRTRILSLNELNRLAMEILLLAPRRIYVKRDWSLVKSLSNPETTVTGGALVSLRI